MKGKIIALIMSFSLIFCVGIGVAYYNTRSFGFSDDTKIITRDSEKITVLDYDIYYNDIDNFIEKAKEILPEYHFAV